MTGALAMAGIVVLRVDAPGLAAELTGAAGRSSSPSLVLGAAALVRLGQRAPFGTRVARRRGGRRGHLGLGRRPVPGHPARVAVPRRGRGPAGSLGACSRSAVIAAALIAPSLGLLYWLTQRSRLAGHAPEAAADPAGRID